MPWLQLGIEMAREGGRQLIVDVRMLRIFETQGGYNAV